MSSFLVDTDYASALALFGLHRSNHPAPPVIVEGQLRLDGSEHPALRARPATDDIDVFKRWIGVPDRAIREGAFARPVLLPELPPGRLDRPIDALSDVEFDDLRKAANAYLFDDSALWQEYRGAVTRHLAPFHLAVYAFDSIEIAAGCTLQLAETPSVLIVDRLIMNEGAGINVTMTARLVFNHLHTEGTGEGNGEP
jgi:hypothetical protein